MSTTTIAIILIGLFILLLIFWLVRSRGNTTGHIDTTLTAVGAATEAVEDIVESVTHRAEASEAKPANVTAEPAKKAPAQKAMAKKAAATKAPAPKAATRKAPTTKTKRADPIAVETASAEILAGGNGTAMLPIGIAAAQGAPDNLRQLKGVGPKLVERLTELGITRIDQIARWTEADAAKVDAHLGAFQGRIARDYWIDQARFLAAGDIAGFEARFGKLDG
jgi:predicted flap endonuclease-1-like 5' DNA nuclease